MQQMHQYGIARTIPEEIKLPRTMNKEPQGWLDTGS